jgi:choice-of-anchor B domain-containing protein
MSLLPRASLASFLVLSLQPGVWAQFPASGVNLMSHVAPDDFTPMQTWGNKLWGYTSPAGQEYAIVGLQRGTGFVDVTDPGQPHMVGLIDGPDSGWRAMKAYKDHAYIVSEGGNGIQVVDLTQIDSGSIMLVNTVLTPDPTNTHNLALDEASGFLYRCNFFNDPGLRFYDLADPANPAYVGSWGVERVHDAQVVTYNAGPYANSEIAFACSPNGVPTLSIIDVTDKANPLRRGEVTYPFSSLSHNVALSEDRQWAFLNDENSFQVGAPSTVFVFDVSDIDNPLYVTSFTNGNTSSTHDSVVKGNLLLSANLSSGLRIFDVSDPLNAVETAFFDTWPCDDGPTPHSLQANYPLFSSGIVIGNTREDGLFVWTLGPPQLGFSYPTGLPALIDPSGDKLIVRILEEISGDLLPNSARLHFDTGLGEQAVPLLPVEGALHHASLPSLPCGSLLSYYVSAQSQNGFTWTDPPAATTSPERHYASVAQAETILFADDFELDQGWTTSAQNPNAGFWERVDPIGMPDAPEDDFTPGAGTMCWVTHDGPPGCRKFFRDVSGGPYILTSPILDLSSALDPFIRYARWFANNGNGTRNDVFTVEISADGGNWVTVETIGPNPPQTDGGWIVHQFHVSDFIPLSATVQVRFTAVDEPNDSGVEAAVDDFLVFDPACSSGVTYCEAKLTSCGTLPAISATGRASATATSGFIVSASNARQGKLGALLYTDMGRATTPFQGGILCLKPPIRRTPKVLSSGGVGGHCDAGFAIDVNSFASGSFGGTPQAYLLSIGQMINVQWWGRDSLSSGSYLTEGLEYVVGW